MKPLTRVYIDGFNLYHGAVEYTAYKWLNIGKLCELLLPDNHIDHIHYFTSPATDSPDDPHRSIRQRVFWRALDTLPNLTRHNGNFVSRPRKYPLALARPYDDQEDKTLVFLREGGPVNAIIRYTEEKGSDVNLATRLLTEAFRCRFQVAVVISNDADLVEPIRVVTDELELPVGVVNPRPKFFSKKLGDVASFKRNLPKKLLRVCQLPDEMSDEHGTFHKPTTW